MADFIFGWIVPFLGAALGGWFLSQFWRLIVSVDASMRLKIAKHFLKNDNFPARFFWGNTMSTAGFFFMVFFATSACVQSETGSNMASYPAALSIFILGGFAGGLTTLHHIHRIGSMHNANALIEHLAAEKQLDGE